MTEDRRVALGIDLGARWATAAWLRAGESKPEIAPTSEGARRLPSSVFVGARGECLVGRQALLTGEFKPQGLVSDWKDHLVDPHWARGAAGREHGAVGIAALLLGTLRKNALAHGGAEPKTTVLTVPSLWGDLERGALLDAARAAGFAAPRLLNEPTAAALDFAFQPAHVNHGARRLLVFNMGPTALGVTLVELASGSVRVVATGGDRRLGTHDWTETLAGLVAEIAYEKTAFDPREDHASATLLRARCERAREALAAADSATVECPLPGRGSIAVAVTRELFEERTRSLVARALEPVEHVLGRASWEGDVDVVLAAGDAPTMPPVLDAVGAKTGRRVVAVPHHEESLARGAALYAACVAGDLKLSLELGSDSTEIETPRARPRKKPSGLAETYSEWALWAADDEYPALPGEIGTLQVLDVVTQSLGVLVFGRSGAKNSIVIRKETAVPAAITKTFVTFKDGQTSVQLKILQGDDADPRRCTVVGRLLVSGLPPGRPAGQNIALTYRYDEDGRVAITARDVASGVAAETTIERTAGLSKVGLEKLAAEVSLALAR